MTKPSIIDFRACVWDTLTYKLSNDLIKTKDFRSSCATYFLKQGWTTDDIKGRLGHKPSSKVIDKYVSYLGLSQRKLKRKAAELDLSNYQKKYKHLEESHRYLQDQLSQLNAKLDKSEKADKVMLRLLSDKDIRQALAEKLVSLLAQART